MSDNETTVSMSAREMAFFRAGRCLGRADAYTELAEMSAKNAEQASLQEWSRRMKLWFESLAHDVGKLRGVGGPRGKQASGAMLAKAIAEAVPNLNLPQQAIERHFVETEQKLRAKAEQAKGDFGRSMVAADNVSSTSGGGLVRQFVRQLIAEVSRGR